MRADAAFPVLRREVTQDLLHAYAEVSGDHNPLHLDPTSAEAAPFGGTIAHGMLLLGYLSDLMGRVYGPAWASTGHLRGHFRAPARPGDIVTVMGEVRSVEEGPEGAATVRCVLQCQTGTGEIVARGDAWVRLLPSEGRGGRE